MIPIRIPTPRMLPLTMVVMVVLLVLKAAGLVRAATPSPEAPPPPAAAAPTALAPTAAKPPTPATPAPVAAPLVAAPPAAPAASAAAGKAPETSDAERALLLDLRHRRAELDARDATLASREAVLAATEKRLTTRLEELGGLQTRLEAMEKARKSRDDQNWQGLVKLYEQMKPRDAATIFNDLDKPVLLAVLDRMKEAKAAAVLAAMAPERARQATADLARLRTQSNTPASAGG